MTIELTNDEVSQLMLMCGYALGVALGRGEKELAYGFLRLANRINETNPNWTRYEIPGEAKP